VSGLRDALDPEEISTRLLALPHWRMESAALHSVLPLKAYLDGVELIAQLAQIAEELDHHPRLTLNYDSIAIRVNTHLPPGISALDFLFVERVEGLRS